MAFTSLYFLIFAVVTVGVFYIIPSGFRWIWLLIASYAFYLLSSLATFVFLLLTTVTTFLGGLYIGGVNRSFRWESHSILSSLQRTYLTCTGTRSSRIGTSRSSPCSHLPFRRSFRGRLADMTSWQGNSIKGTGSNMRI